MNRTRVVSRSIHSIGFEPGQGAEIQFHAKHCIKRERGGDPCDCDGGGIYLYPDVPAWTHAELMAAPSIGGHFMKHIRNAKNAEGKPLYASTFIPKDGAA